MTTVADLVALSFFVLWTFLFVRALYRLDARMRADRRRREVAFLRVGRAL